MWPEDGDGGIGERDADGRIWRAWDVSTGDSGHGPRMAYPTGVRAPRTLNRFAIMFDDRMPAT
jgi:hypothetical protein